MTCVWFGTEISYVIFVSRAGNPIEYDGERTVEALVDFIDSFKYTAPQSAVSAEVPLVPPSLDEEVSAGEAPASGEVLEDRGDYVNTVAADGDGTASLE